MIISYMHTVYLEQGHLLHSHSFPPSPFPFKQCLVTFTMLSPYIYIYMKCTSTFYTPRYPFFPPPANSPRQSPIYIHAPLLSF
jgi:hypothetical protein